MIGGSRVDLLENRPVAQLRFDTDEKPSFSGVGRISKKNKKNNFSLRCNQNAKFLVLKPFPDCGDHFKEWAKQMLDGDVNNPTFLKQVIENFKLTVSIMKTVICQIFAPVKST